jgi:hypothetical protein
MFQEIWTLQTFFANRILPLFPAGFLQFTELEALDAAVVVLVPVFVIPGPTQRQKLSFSQLQRV